MTATQCILFDADSGSLVLAAATWISGFYPHVTVAHYSNKLELSAAELDAEALNTIWLAALANEQLHLDGRDERARTLAALAA